MTCDKIIKKGKRRKREKRERMLGEKQKKYKILVHSLYHKLTEWWYVHTAPSCMHTEIQLHINTGRVDRCVHQHKNSTPVCILSDRRLMTTLIILIEWKVVQE